MNNPSGETRMKQEKQHGMKLATLGGGCFWCLEAIFEQVRGVIKVTSGYAGGHVPNPTYEQVCTGTTGHAEVVQILHDPKIIDFQELLEIFFSIHDPTTKDRQGNDVGPQYRSIILYHDETQKKIATQVIKELNESNHYKKPIVTEIVPFNEFYPAEEYHQQYFKNNPNQPYCQYIIFPKINKFRTKFSKKLKE